MWYEIAINDTRFRRSFIIFLRYLYNEDKISIILQFFNPTTIVSNYSVRTSETQTL